MTTTVLPEGQLELFLCPHGECEQHWLQEGRLSIFGEPGLTNQLQVAKN